jgi:hypothetical protein
MDKTRALALLGTARMNLNALESEIERSEPDNSTPSIFIPKPVDVTSPDKIALPIESPNALTKFYGTPSSNPNYLDWFSFPHPEIRLYSRIGANLKDYSGDSRLDHRTHKLLTARLTQALAEIYRTLGEEAFVKQGWHVYGGSHNYRPKVGGSSLSTHAWACAVDMNPAENPFARTTTTFSDVSIDIMEKWGFLSGGRAWGKDWMHFQACIPVISHGSFYAKNGIPGHIVKAA